VLATDITQTALSIAALALIMASAPVIFASYVFAQQPNATMSSCPPAMNATTGANAIEARFGELANETTNQTTGAEQFVGGATNATTAAC
jgi:hypothetical protein